MNEDTRQELERLESALLAAETEKEEQGESVEDFLDGLLDDPTDSLAQTGPMVYQNFANGYGQNRIEEDEPQKPENLTGLMFTAAGLLVAIGAVIIYWVVRFL